MIFDKLLSLARMPEDTELYVLPVPECPEARPEVFEKCPELSRDLSKSVLESVQGRNRTARSTRIEEKRTPLHGTYIIMNATVLVAAAGTTLARFPVYVQLAFYSFALASVIGTDPLFLFGRILAPQSRYLTSILFILITICQIVHRKEMYIVTLLYAAIELLLIGTLNRIWMDAFNFRMSPAVQQILNNSPDSRAFEAWNYFGKRDSVTLARYQGNSAEESVVNGLYRAFWMLGFNSAYQNVTALINRAEKAERAAEDYKKRYEEAEVEKKQLAAVNENLMSSEEEARGRAESSKWKIERLEKDLTAAQDQVQKLLQTNEELITMTNDSEIMAAAANLVEEDTERHVIELLKSGYSVRKVAELTGWSKTAVGNMRKELSESGELKVVSIKQATA